MNLEFEERIIGILDTIIDAVVKARECYIENEVYQCNVLLNDTRDGLAAIINATNSKELEMYNRLIGGCECAIYSLEDILNKIQSKDTEVVWKLKYELRAIINGTLLEFFKDYIAPYYQDGERLLNERILASQAFESDKNEEYNDLSIVVVTYNHLDMASKCVDYVLRNLPKNKKTEVIVYNHGSNDGTKEYFERFSGIHLVNVKINRTCDIIFMPGNAANLVVVSNDVLVGANVFANILKALEEHPDYGFVVPSTPNVSNLQTIDANYTDEITFVNFTRKNNIYDCKRHEQRVRLCNPVTGCSRNNYALFYIEYFLNTLKQGNYSFPDDKMSLWMRRRGLKNILMKDAFCHHFGSVTIKEEAREMGIAVENLKYAEGRKLFEKEYGVDPWGTGFCYSLQLLSLLHIEKKDGAKVLGINCGLGSNSLKVYEMLRECGSKDLELYNFVEDKKFLADLKGLPGQAYEMRDLSDVIEKTGCSQFDYIVIEDDIADCRPNEYRRELEKASIEVKPNFLYYLDGDDIWKQA